jgi:hypothetical protein
LGGAFKSGLSGLQSLLKGDIGGALKGLWDFLSKGFGGLIKGISGLFSGAGGGGGSGGIGSLLGGLGSMGSLFSSFGGPGGLAGLAPMGSALEFFLFADGGKVKGKGTDTSDSIPAMLSNNEFVVNAKQTRKHLGLLNAINTGSIGKFAAGGLVGASMLSTPVAADYKPLSNNTDNSRSQQVVNVNITGDVSRQTKQEIYKMLPSIAVGVNGYNREKGIRN